MEKLLDVISFNYSDPEISGILNSAVDQKAAYSIHFSQNEDSFVKCGSSFKVPSFSIHHDVNLKNPSDNYLKALRTLMSTLVSAYPGLFEGTKYFFDPAEVLRPCFIQVFKLEDSYYLYLLRPDLNVRLSESNILTSSTNDTTAEYETEKLYFDSIFIPIDKPDITASGGKIPIKRMFRSTWVGESGSGYHINGQWIDIELTKILSALYLPENKNAYPYYPFRCDFNTVCFFPADLSLAGRKGFLSYLHKSLPLIKPNLPNIEAGMKTEEFSRKHPLYIDLKKKITEEWTKTWSYLKISPYLNENDMKEYILEFKFP